MYLRISLTLVSAIFLTLLVSGCSKKNDDAESSSPQNPKQISNPSENKGNKNDRKDQAQDDQNQDDPGKQDKGKKRELKIPKESCRLITAAEKQNPLSPGNAQDFYTLAEDVTRFPIVKNQSTYVVGDIHGSWEMIAYAAINSGIMEYDSPKVKKVKIKYLGKDLEVEIPNLKFKAGAENKLIFEGDYIAKNDAFHEQVTLALLTDILEKQKGSLVRSIFAVVGNHDLEAVNGVDHAGYPREKDYRDQILYMIKEGLLAPTHYDHGIWYSHSYLTPDDIAEFYKNRVDFTSINFPSPLDTAIARVNQGVNSFITQHVLNGTIPSLWLSSPSESARHGGQMNFFYVMGGLAADGKTPTGNYENFPIIMGHLSDLNRKVLRVLTEGTGGKPQPYFKRRSHILCVDTSIYDSFNKGSDATYLRIDYSTSGPAVQFNTCTVSTRP